MPEMKIIYFLCYFCVAFLLAGCALPVSEKNQQDFIPERDLTIVELASEGLSYYKRSRYVDAELYLRQALFLAPEAENIRFNLAVVLQKQGLYSEAQEIYDALLAQKPESFRYLLAKAQLHLDQLEFKAAEAYYFKALEGVVGREDKIRSASISRSISTLNFLAGNEEAANCYSQEALYWQNSEEQVFRHSTLLLALGYPEDAATLLEEFLAELGNPLNPKLLSKLAMAYFTEDRLKEVLDITERALLQKNLDSNVAFELRLLRELCLYIEAQAKLELEDKEEGNADKQIIDPRKIALNEEEDDEDKEGSIFESDFLASPQAIYWPATLLARLGELSDLIDELDEEE